MEKNIENFRIEDSLEKNKEFISNTLAILSGKKPDEDGKIWVSEVPDKVEHSSDKGNKYKTKARIAWPTNIGLLYGYGVKIGIFTEEKKIMVEHFIDSAKEIHQIVNQIKGPITEEIKTMASDNIKEDEQIIDELSGQLEKE